jgi:hypothetical protein
MKTNLALFALILGTYLLRAQPIPPWINGGKPWWTGRPHSVAPPDTNAPRPPVIIKHWIQKNIGSGSYIILEDGSLWAIDPLDKINAMLWLPISSIIVVHSTTGSAGFNYLLINTDDKEKAHAKFIGKT